MENQPGKKKSKLTEQQKLFVRAYMRTWNATEAARKAGYSRKTAAEQGSRLLRNVHVRAAIKKRQELNRIEFGISQESIVGELAKIAFFDMRNVMNQDSVGVSMRPWPMIDSNVSGAIASITETPNMLGVSRAVKAHDKIKALELLGKHVGLWKEGNSGSGNDKDAQRDVIGRLSHIISKHRKRGGEGTSDPA